ncbi:MAG: DUF4065 domain-containing protein [Oscillospiraceae bacterium]|jgi:uncharacterized phage-associated protein|nr:DUF4065 domain-containing protein [Oscillospiraceae bacterium]
MASAFDAAKFFIGYNQGTEYDDISNMKLQKLLYYAQGHSLERFGRVLFPEPIEAWEHGPVVRDVYVEYSNNKSAPIPSATKGDVSRFDRDELNLLHDVYQEYGQYSASKLRDMTHGDGLAWSRVYKSPEEKRVIEKDLIASDFENMYLDGEPNEETLEAIRELDEHPPQAMSFEEFATLMKNIESC